MTGISFINRSKDGKMGYRRNNAAIDKVLSRCGFFLLAETDFCKTTSEILDINRRRDTIEKSFDNLKNDLDMHRLHIHNDETAEGKVFCAFLSLVVLSDMMNCFGEYISRNPRRSTSLFRAPARSSGKSAYARSYTLLNPLSKTVKEIFSLLNIPSKRLGSFV